MFGQSKTRSSNQIIFITLFSSKCIGLDVLCLVPASANSAHLQEAKWHISKGAKKNQLLGFSNLHLAFQASFAPLVY
jgi:hypothetical protein